MLNRNLSRRELEILQMIRPTNFQDIVDEVRKEVENNRYNARRLIRNLKNGGGLNSLIEDNGGGHNGHDNEKDNSDNGAKITDIQNKDSIIEMVA